jgi:hypothetical protein
VPVPLLTPRLSSLWVSLVTGAPRELVAPLVQSLRHTMIGRDQRLVQMAGLRPMSFDRALEEALGAHGPGLGAVAPRRPPPRKVTPAPDGGSRALPTVRSVQRLPHPPGMSATDAMTSYLSWLPTALRPLLRVQVDPPAAQHRRCRITLAPLRRPLLELLFATERSTPDRSLLYVTGGLLVRPTSRGRFELREVLAGRALLAAIHDFSPRIPWPLYTLTQARLHVWVMRAFGRALAAGLGARSPAGPAFERP